MTFRRRAPVVAAVVAATLLSGIGHAAFGAAAGPSILRASLDNGGRPCSTSTASPLPLGMLAETLQAVGSDSDPSISDFRYTFAIAPTDRPTTETDIAVDRQEPGDLASAHVPSTVLHNGTTYSWRVRLSDSDGTSPWSQTCVFRYDVRAPAAPTVTSANYPTNGSVGPLGQPAQFTFDGNGDRDTAGFLWGWDILSVPVCEDDGGPQRQLACPDYLDADNVTRADAPGGSATVSLSPPQASSNQLVVVALDSAGNESSTVRYEIFVPSSGPTVTTRDGGLLCGTDPTVTFKPAAGVTGVTAYRYTVDSGTTYSTVPAGRNGTARVHIAPKTSPVLLAVQSLGAGGYVSTAGDADLRASAAPGIASDTYPRTGVAAGGVGVAGTFTFTTPDQFTNVGQYRYRVANLAHLVAADADSAATVQYTPSSAGTQSMVVTGFRTDGSQATCRGAYIFLVAGSTTSPPTTSPPTTSPPTGSAPPAPGSTTTSTTAVGASSTSAPAGAAPGVDSAQAPDADGAPLADTGADTRPLLFWALLLLALGMLLLVTAHACRNTRPRRH